MTTNERDHDIAKLQRMFSEASLTGDRETWAEYEASVYLFAGKHDMDLADAYLLVEEGPIVYALGA